MVAGEIVGRLLGAPVLPPTSAFVDAQEWRYADWIEKDHALFWRYRPSQTIAGRFIRPGRYTINSRGFRGPEFPVEKQSNVQRVVCLGESSTFGLGVADDIAWPRQLEKRLNALDPQKRRWEVLNLGVTNYSTFQAVRLARKELPSLQPDIVMFCFSWADHQQSARGVSDDRLEIGGAWRVSIENTLNRSALVRWLRAGWASIFPPAPPEPVIPGFQQRRVATTEYSENMEKLAREAIAVGARPILVTSPISWPPSGMSDTSGVFFVHQRYRLLGRFGAIAGGAEFVELANAFDQYPRFYDDRRKENELFNADGHAFAGDFLARYLLGDTAVVNNYGSQMLLR